MNKVKAGVCIILWADTTCLLAKHMGNIDCDLANPKKKKKSYYKEREQKIRSPTYKFNKRGKKRNERVSLLQFYI